MGSCNMSESTTSTPFMQHSYRQQSFSFPDTVIYNITQNPSNPEGYQKLIQTCKYFFAKSSMLVFHCLWHRLDEEWITCLKMNCSKYKDLNGLPKKIWVTKFLAVWSDSSFPRYFQPRTIASSIFPRLYKYDILNLEFVGQIIYDNELLMFPELERLSLDDTLVLSKNNNSVIPLEKILEFFPKLIGLSFKCDEAEESITSKTVKEILKIPNLHKFQFFILENIPDCFDIDRFYEYLKKNVTTQCHLEFSGAFSDEFQNHLEAIIDEILENESPNYIVPYICFPQLCYLKQENLRSRLLLKTYAYSEFFLNCVRKS